MESTHPSLLERLRDFSDHAAWRDFDVRYRDLILRYCQRRGLQAADAEDIRQMAVMALARCLERFVYRPDVGRFRDYLGRIVQNLIHHHFKRRQGRHEQPLTDPTHLVAPCDRDEAWEEEWRLQHYRTAMRKVRETFLPANLQIFDALVDGRPVDELAQEFATTRDAIYKVKQRVRERLEELIGEQVREELLPRGDATAGERRRRGES